MGWLGSQPVAKQNKVKREQKSPRNVENGGKKKWKIIDF